MISQLKGVGMQNVHARRPLGFWTGFPQFELWAPRHNTLREFKV